MSGSELNVVCANYFFHQFLAYIIITYTIQSKARQGQNTNIEHLNSSAKSTIEDMSHFSIFLNIFRVKNDEINLINYSLNYFGCC